MKKDHSNKIPLFEHYPLLADKLDHVSLGASTTPVEKLDRLGEEIGVNKLYVKRDDLSGSIYGGNKIRKLEFTLGRSLRAKAKEVLTFGCAGSNHALATAIYAKQVGLKSISMLLPQPNARYVRRNLLMSRCSDAELHQHGNTALLAAGTVYQLVRHGIKTGRFPQVIPPGGSSPLGTIGFVNAAFELKNQIEQGEILEPECVYVALGTMGTAVGLMLGLRAAGLKTRVVSVRVVWEKMARADQMERLFHKTNSILHSLDRSFPMFELTEKEVDLRHDFYGREYALFTEEGMQAVDWARKCEGLKLEGTYTGKAMAALIDDAGKGALKDGTVLFWNTYNSRDFSNTADGVDYHELPKVFHRYFEDEVQPLDRES